MVQIIVLPNPTSHDCYKWLAGLSHSGLKVISLMIFHNSDSMDIYTLRFNEVERGYTGFTFSVRLSVRLSVHPSVLSALYLQQYLPDQFHILHILSSNIRRCVALKVVGFFQN